MIFSAAGNAKSSASVGVSSRDKASACPASCYVLYSLQHGPEHFGGRKDIVRRRDEGFMLLSALFVLMICAVLSTILMQSMLSSSAKSTVNHVSLQAGWYASTSVEFVGDSERYCAQTLQLAQTSKVVVSGQSCKLEYRCNRLDRVLNTSVSCVLDDGSHIMRAASKTY